MLAEKNQYAHSIYEAKSMNQSDSPFVLQERSVHLDYEMTLSPLLTDYRSEQAE